MPKRTTYIKKITTADVVEHWGASLVLPGDNFNYAVCNAKGEIKWDTTRLVTAHNALEKGYVLIKP